MTDAARLRYTCWLVATGLLLGACAHDDDDASRHSAGAPSAQSSGASSEPPAPSPSRRPTHQPWSDVNPPPRRAGDFVVKQLALTRSAPEDDGRAQPAPRRGGPEFWGEEVRTCVRTSSRHRHVLSWRDWRARGVDGRVYRADAVDSQPLRTPAYPFRRVLAPGECATGWWLIPVPQGTGIDAIEFAPGGGHTLIAWRTLR